MTKKVLCMLFLALFMLSVSQATASNGTQIGTVGARSTAMGSCFRGLSDDWSAVYFNPGGLTQLSSKWTIGFSGAAIMPRGSYTALPYPAAMAPFSGMNLNEVDATARNFLVPALGVFYKASEKLTIGLGVYAPFGLGTEWDFIDVPASYGNTVGISKDKESYSDHQVITIQPTIAYKVSDKLSIGLGVSYIHGKMDLDMVKLAFNPAAASWPALTVGLAGYGVTLPALTPDQYRLLLENNLSGAGTAYGANFGIHFQATDKLSIGLSGRYCTDLKLEGDNTQTLIMHGDAVKFATLDAVPAAAFASAEDPTGAATKAMLMGVFSGMNMTTKSDVEAKLPLPITAGAGIAYKATDKLTIVADASWTQWSTWDVIEVEMEDADNLELKQDWTDTIELGCGFEYSASDMLAIRAGFYTVDSPVPDATMNPTLLDPNRRNVITGGLGLNLGKITLNFTGEYVLFADKEINEYEFDAATGVAENYAGTYKFNAMVFTLGAQINL
ncbi:outer membrane protein transport protein [bacterium]|nr:outer membrane protein transport protein [bacterium]